MVEESAKLDAPKQGESMDAAQIEPVSSHSTSERLDWPWLLAIALLAVSVRGWLIAHTQVTARDSIGFIRLALHLQSPPEDKTLAEVLRAAEHPPGYSLALAAVAGPIRQWLGTTAESMMLAAQLTSVLASLLLIPVTYRIALRCFDRSTALGAVALYQMLPVCVRLTTDGLSEGVYLLVVAGALCGAIESYRSPRWWKMLLAGLACGAAYLVRPEGLLLVPVIGGVLLGLAWRTHWSWRMTSTQGLALLLGTAALAGPYMYLIGGITNKPTGRSLLEFFQGRSIQPTWKQADAGHLPWASFMQATDPYSPAQWATQELLKEMLKTCHYGVPVLALIGLATIVRRRQFGSGHALLLLYLAGQLALLWLMAVKIRYVSERHALVPAWLACCWAAAGLPVVVHGLRALLPRLAAWGSFTLAMTTAWGLIVMVCVPATLRPLHANRAGHAAVGRWLAVHGEPDRLLLDPFCWAAYFANGPASEPYRGEGSTQRVHYVVLEPEHRPHSRLPLLDLAREVARGGQIVYHWPPERAVDKADVVLYRVVPQPPAGDNGPRR